MKLLPATWQLKMLRNCNRRRIVCRIHKFWRYWLHCDLREGNSSGTNLHRCNKSVRIDTKISSLFNQFYIWALYFRGIWNWWTHNPPSPYPSISRENIWYWKLWNTNRRWWKLLNNQFSMIIVWDPYRSESIHRECPNSAGDLSLHRYLLMAVPYHQKLSM